MPSRYKQSEFRITTWPGHGLALPAPRVQPLPFALDEEEERLVPLGRVPSREERFALLVGEADVERLEGWNRSSTGADSSPRADGRDLAAIGEVYLELERTELDDPRAILRFANRFGILGVRFREFSAFGPQLGFRDHIRPALEESWPAEVREAVKDADRLARAVIDWDETLAEFRFGARRLRDLRSAWLVTRGELDLSRFEWQSFPENVSIADARAAAEFLHRGLTLGLQPFHPRLRLLAEEGRPADLWVVPFNVTLYSACCLELYNHIVKHARYRVCANESCRRVFVRQRGRAGVGQYRQTGIKYCSRHCARAQAQRAYRARQQTKAQA